MSLWTIPWLCKYSRPSISWQKYLGGEGREGGDKIKVKTCPWQQAIWTIHPTAQTNLWLWGLQRWPRTNQLSGQLLQACSLESKLAGETTAWRLRVNIAGRLKSVESEDLPVSLKYWKPFLWDTVQHFLHPTNTILHHHIRALGVKDVCTNQICMCFSKYALINKQESGPLNRNVSI